MKKTLKLAGAAMTAALLAACGTASTARPATPATHATAQAVSLPASQLAKTMGVKNDTVYTAATDPNHLLGRQREYTSKVNWGSDEDNSIEVFPTASDAALRRDYVTGFQCPFGDGYDYLSGTALLRVSCSQTPVQAAAADKLFAKAAKS